LKKLKPIIFNFRYDDESGDEPYQLIVSRHGAPANNTELFLQFYKLLASLVNSGSENTNSYYLAPALEYHYWKFSPRFAFVNVLADQHDEAEKNGHLTLPRINNYLRHWIEQKGNNSAIYEGTIRLPALVDEKMSVRQNIPVGTPYTYIPKPRTHLEAFQRLKFLMGQQVCEYHVRQFEQKYQQLKAEIYTSELATINNFIDDIDYTDLKAAFECHDNDHAREYLRITHGYYDNHRCEQAMGSTVSIVYGKYILYKKWLENRLRETFSGKKARGLPQLIPSKVSSDFILGQELFNALYQRGLLSDFFEVAAPPVKGQFWYDINDRETDDPAKVVRVSPVSISQTRRAKPEDFQIVLDQVNIIGDKNSKAYQHFLDDLIVCIEQMIGYHRTLHKPEEREENHYQLIELAESFIAWLRSESTPIPIVGNQQVEKKQSAISLKDIQVLDDLKKRTEGLPYILHLRAHEVGYQFTDDDKALVLDTYSKLDDILKELAAFINIRFPGCERHVKAWNDIDFDTKIGDIKIRTNDREHIKREWKKGIFDLISLIKVLRNEAVLLVDDEGNFAVNRLNGISSEHTLEHYTNKEVIPNQNLVNETITFYETGQGKGIITALEMLNLINKQQNFVMMNYNSSEVVVQHLKNLPLNERTRHSLFGFLLKWFGGYPVNNLNEELNTTLKLIQAEFLSFKDDTPEKQYCRADQIMRNKFEKYGIALTSAINNGIDVGELLAAMEIGEPREIIFQNFNDLFTVATKSGLIEDFADKKEFLIAQAAYNYQFNVWLQEYKGWEYRNEEQYRELLTTDISKEFLNHKKAKAITSIDKRVKGVTTSNQRITPKLSIRQVALLCHYTDCTVTRATATAIVEKYGHTSGDSLFNDYTYYRSKANRLGAETTKKKNANKLRLFERVHEYLYGNEAAKNKINDDLIALRETIEKANLTL
jgi:hypothetical protein